MDRSIGETVRRLAETWAQLTGGGLFVWSQGSWVPGESAGPKLPAAVRRAVDERSPLEAHPGRERTWWVTAPEPAASGEIQLVAWARKGRAWGVLLHTWSGLLSRLIEEASTAEGLTSELIDAWDRLTFLYDLAKIAGRHIDLAEMLEDIVRLLARVVSVQDVMLVVARPEGLASFTASGKEIPLPEVLVGSVAGARRPLALEEVRPALERAGSPLAWSGELLVTPLQGPGGPGALGLLNPPTERFDAHDVQLLASVAEQVSSLIEAADTRAEREKNQRLEHELEIASNLQRSLLPLHLPEASNLSAAAYLRPARRVGGDFYDAVATETGAILLLLADVAGKGMPAALLTALVHAVFISEAADWSDPGDLLQMMNRRMFPDLDRAETFVTAAVLRLETGLSRFAYASAGHNDIAVWRGGEERIEFLPASGLPLGIDPDTAYRSRAMPLASGDEVILYSDGVTEAEGVNGTLFGAEGLSAIISATFPAPAVDQIRAIVEGLDVHRADRPLRDDVALLLVKVGEESGDRVRPFVLPASRASVSDLLEMAREMVAGFSFGGSPADPQFVDEFVLALSEIVTNQIQHAYLGQGGSIEGRLTIARDHVAADLYDRGVRFQPQGAEREAVDPANPPERGYGLRLARALLEECRYTRLGDGRNHWRLVKRAKGDPSP
jgi:sigma-B regulation protein RsbU (phosphoserine phosphatase)